MELPAAGRSRRVPEGVTWDAITFPTPYQDFKGNISEPE
jgi:hypothetical protein